MKENLKPCVYKLWEHAMCDRVLFVERSGELRLPARLIPQGEEPEGDRVSTVRRVGSRRPETG